MRATLVVLLLAAVLGLAAGVYSALRLDAAPQAASAAAIDSLFSTPFADLEGRATTLARWRETPATPIVVNFWATWCPPCREEMPDLSRLQQQHPEARFVGIAVDAAAQVAAFAARHPVSYPLLVAAGDGMALSRQLGNETLALPHTVVVVKGRVEFSKVGRINAAELDARLRQIAARAAP